MPKEVLCWEFESEEIAVVFDELVEGLTLALDWYPFSSEDVDETLVWILAQCYIETDPMQME